MTNLFVSAYWGPRRESREACAERLDRFGKKLVTWDDTLAQWFRPGQISPTKSVEVSVDVTDATVWTRLLDKGRHRRDMDRTVIEELGYQIRLWNGRRDAACEAVFSSICGSYAERGSPNTVLVKLPRELDPLAKAGTLAQALEDTASIWQPEWAAVVSSHTIRTRPFSLSLPLVDWMLYLPRPVPSLPEPSVVHEVPGGSLIVVQPTPDDPDAATHIANVEKALGITGVAAPTA